MGRHRETKRDLAYRAMERESQSECAATATRARRAMSALINHDPGYMAEVRYYAARQQEWLLFQGLLNEEE
jgi:hypothetical protein